MGLKRYRRKLKAGVRELRQRAVIRRIGEADILRINTRVEERWRDMQGMCTLPNVDALVDGLFYIAGADVAGDLAEFGTASGRSAFAIARAANLVSRRRLRRLHLFDSFEGLPEIAASADVDSPHVRKGEWAKGACRVLDKAALERLVASVYPTDLVTFYAGWFSDTVAALPGTTRFAFIHFDGDLYQSTIDTFEPILSRGMLSPGAMVLFDDWNCNRADPRYGERRAWAELSERHAIGCDDLGPYGWSGRKFIVHEYRGVPRDAAA